MKGFVKVYFDGKLTQSSEYASYGEARERGIAVRSYISNTFGNIITRRAEALLGSAHYGLKGGHDIWVFVRHEGERTF